VNYRNYEEDDGEEDGIEYTPEHDPYKSNLLKKNQRGISLKEEMLERDLRAYKPSGSPINLRRVDGS